VKLRICHLYPDLLDLYGDRGNILCLAARSRWRGIEADVRRVSLGEPLNLSETDILFLGGGSDREQGILFSDLQRHAGELQAAIADGLVVLAICGGYQLLGEYYQTASGDKIPGLGVLNLWTVAGSQRLIGNVLAELLPSAIPGGGQTGLRGQTSASDQSLPISTLVGFENHSGQTFLGEGVQPLVKVRAGYGNNGRDGGEGVRAWNVVGTYLHGPLLPKNPHLADFLLGLALQRRGLALPLSKLDDRLEQVAHQVMVNRLEAR